MPLDNPSKEALDRIIELKRRAERKAKDSLQDFHTNKKLVEGDLAAWEDQSPLPSVNGKNTIVVRNSVGQDVYDDADRLMPTDPIWDCDAIVPTICVQGDPDPMTGQPKELEVDNVDRSLRFRAASNFVSRATKQYDEVYRCILDARTGDNGFMLISVPDHGPDVSHTASYPTASSEGGTEADQKVGKKIPRGKTIHGGVIPYLPVFLREPPDNIFLDPDACTDKEVNCIFRWVCRPLADIKKDPRYKNTANLKANAQYQGLRYQPITDPQSGAQLDSGKDGQASDMLGFWEYHYRIPSPQGMNTTDGYLYYVMAIVETGSNNGPQTQSSSEPVMIRHDPYPVDQVGFAIKRLQFTVANDDLYGFSAPIRFARRSNATENAVMSMFTGWVMKNKTKRIWNKNLLSADDIQVIEDGDENDNILLNLKSDADLSRMVAVLPANQIPPELVQLIMMLRSITSESGGRSANQRGQTSGAGSASEAQIMDQQTKKKMGAMQFRFRRFMEEVQRAGMAIFSALLPENQPNGKKWAIPDPQNRGKYIDFSASDLECSVTLSLDYASMESSDDAVIVKQGTDLLGIIAKMPPQLLMAAEPLIRRIALALGPAWEVQIQKVYDNIRLAGETVGDPDKQHNLLLNGHEVAVDPQEDLTVTIPQHDAQAKIVGQYPQDNPAWFRPLGQDQEGTITPLVLLIRHIAESKAEAMKKGIPIAGEQAPQGKAEKGSGPGALRQTQNTPTDANVQAGAGNVTQNSGA